MDLAKRGAGGGAGDAVGGNDVDRVDVVGGGRRRVTSGFGVRGLYLKCGVFYYRGPQRYGMRPAAVCLRTGDLSEALIAVDEFKRDEATAVVVLTMQAVQNGVTDARGERRDLVNGVSGVSGRGGSVRLSQLIDRYLHQKDKFRQFTQASMVNARQMLGAAQRFFGDCMVGSLTPTRMDEYEAHLRDASLHPGMKMVRGKGQRKPRGLSDATVHTYMNRLRCFFSWAVQQRLIALSPMRLRKMGKVRVTRIHEFLTREEREMVLAHPCVRDEVMVILMLGFFAGLRIREMLALRWCDVRDDGGERMDLVIEAHDWFVPKGKSARKVPANDRLRLFLRGLRRQGDADGDYVLAPRHAWREGCANGYRYNPKKSFHSHIEAAGVGWHVTYHHLRHSYITHHLNAGTSMSLISQWTGDHEETLRSNYAGYAPDRGAVEAI